MIVTFGSINVDFVFSVADMPQPGRALLANGFRTEAGGKGTGRPRLSTAAIAIIAGTFGS